MLREKENTDVFRPKEGPCGTPFLDVGLNFKVSGQRQLNEAGFQTARGAPLLATHAWPRSQPGTVTRPQGKRQPEPRGGFRINSKKSASPTPPCRQPAERSKSPQGQALGRCSLAGSRQACLQSQRGRQYLDKRPRAIPVCWDHSDPPAPAPGCRSPAGFRSGSKPQEWGGGGGNKKRRKSSGKPC